MGYILPPDEYPVCLAPYKGIIRVYVGGCVRGPARAKRFYRSEDNKHIAFAHTHCKAYGRSWLCVPYKSRLRSKELMLHELAHVLSKREGHARGHHKHWRSIVRELGGELAPYKVSRTLTSKDHRPFLERILDLLWHM